MKGGEAIKGKVPIGGALHFCKITVSAKGAAGIFGIDPVLGPLGRVEGVISGISNETQLCVTRHVDIQ